MLALYKRQTISEQAAKETIEFNGVGFNGVDGKMLSEIAELLLADKSLTSKQIAETRRRMLKYVNQLRDIANQKESCN